MNRPHVAMSLISPCSIIYSHTDILILYLLINEVPVGLGFSIFYRTSRFMNSVLGYVGVINDKVIVKVMLCITLSGIFIMNQ